MTETTDKTETPDHQPLTEAAIGIATELGLHRSAAVLLLIDAATEIAIGGPCPEENPEDWEYLAHAVVRLSHAILENAWECCDGQTVEHAADREKDQALS